MITISNHRNKCYPGVGDQEHDRRGEDRDLGEPVEGGQADGRGVRHQVRRGRI